VLGIIVKVVVLAGMVPLVDAVLSQLMTPVAVNEDRRVLLRNLFYGAVVSRSSGLAMRTFVGLSPRSPRGREPSRIAR